MLVYRTSSYSCFFFSLRFCLFIQPTRSTSRLFKTSRSTWLWYYNIPRNEKGNPNSYIKALSFQEKLVSRWGKFAFQIKRNCHEDLFVTKNSDSLVSGRVSRRFSSCQKFTLLLLYGFQTTLWIVTLEAFADASHNKKPRIQSFFRGKIARFIWIFAEIGYETGRKNEHVPQYVDCANLHQKFLTVYQFQIQ